MDSNIAALELPAFEMDCRDWLVDPVPSGELDEGDDAPVVAALSTATMTASALSSGKVVFRLGLVDEFDGVLSEKSETPELVDVDFAEGSVRYLITAPHGALALVADFRAEGGDVELMSRFERLMTSFRWAS